MTNSVRTEVTALKDEVTLLRLDTKDWAEALRADLKDSDARHEARYNQWVRAVRSPCISHDLASQTIAPDGAGRTKGGAGTPEGARG